MRALAVASVAGQLQVVYKVRKASNLLRRAVERSTGLLILHGPPECDLSARDQDLDGGRDGGDLIVGNDRFSNATAKVHVGAGRFRSTGALLDLAGHLSVRRRWIRGSTAAERDHRDAQRPCEDFPGVVHRGS